MGLCLWLVQEDFKEVEVEVEKQFSVGIYFSALRQSVFGAEQRDNMALVLTEENKDRLLEDFCKQGSVVSVTLGTGAVRHVNARNILYIEVAEIATRDVTVVEVSDEE